MKKINTFVVMLLAILFIQGCNNNTVKKDESTISVYGTGTVMVKPDMLRMNISLSKMASTTKAVQEEGTQQVLPINNRMMNQYNAVAESVVADVGTTQLPSGELEITTRILAVFLLE